ncbi:hypothetical protein I5907_07665 [Panacibacter sp. DH6]|uniref:Isocitrate dehydrogenase/Hypothetical protein TT1725 C-terminal domain-containing protein n=1 Tax=Panacibacter microcysteis TaxID=2793269 RepID=A0A931GTZ1_9BACT|nr:hypothetical protein [Panacibacter microcysteis]MBG9376106.1 hypothetical protein [Panacibacter microcysteis]
MLSLNINYCWSKRYATNDKLHTNDNETYREAIELQLMLHNADMEIIKTENLYLFDGEPAFTAAQGQ